MGEKGDCLRCYLRHMSCDLRGGRLRFRVAIQASQTVPLVCERDCGFPCRGMGRFDSQKSPFREKWGNRKQWTSLKARKD